MLNALAGRTVVWRLPVEDITREQNTYIVTTKEFSSFWGSKHYVRTRISVSSQSVKDTEKLRTLKSGDFIKIKGKITGRLYFYDLEIKPAILWDDNKQKAYFSVQEHKTVQTLKDENVELRTNQNASNEKVLNSLLSLIERDKLIVDKLHDHLSKFSLQNLQTACKNIWQIQSLYIVSSAIRFQGICVVMLCQVI